MPRFFFDIHDGRVDLDDVGVDLPDADAAIREAVRGLPEIAAEAISAHDDRRHFSIVVRDEGGAPLYTAALSFCGTRL